MTNEKRDEIMMETHDAVITLKLLAERHDRSLYGDGSKDNPGVISRIQTVEQTHTDCPARKSFENEKTNLQLNTKDSLLSKHLDKLIYAALITILSVVLSHFNGGKVPPEMQQFLKSLPQTAVAEK